MPADVISALEIERLQESARAMDDETLMFSMFGLLAEKDGWPEWGRTEKARAAQRVLFTEIGLRWIPSDVFARGWSMLMEGEDAS